jgi:hypothetical protein
MPKIKPGPLVKRLRSFETTSLSVVVAVVGLQAFLHRVFNQIFPTGRGMVLSAMGTGAGFSAGARASRSLSGNRMARCAFGKGR